MASREQTLCRILDKKPDLQELSMYKSNISEYKSKKIGD